MFLLWKTFDKLVCAHYFAVMRLYKIMLGVLLCGTLCGAATLPKTLLPARETFEVGLQVAAKEGAKRMASIGNEYLQRLGEIENEMQVNGQFRSLVVIHDERVRFARARVLTERPVENPIELRDAQAMFQVKLLQAQYNNELELVKLADHYVRELAVEREAASKSGATSAMRALDEERDRVIGLAPLRQALEITKVRPPSSAEALINPNLGAEGERVRRPLDIFRPASESLHATLDYNLRASVYEDLSKLKPRRSEGGGTKVRAVDGQVGYVPRIMLSCQHSEVPSGSRLVIEYYSRSITDRARHREAVESVLLPRLDRGESYTVEAKGILLFRSEQISSVQRIGVQRSFSGSEFYGLILHVVDPEGHVLVQRFTPQALEREVSATPPEK
ncbi:MAG: hypothetical protein EPN23_08840 [Verrucomicrobia bacterium]|nr:MAG: hypothetical protein EPN23_08840 [Verrucomicrobiota bacterium]